MLGDGPTIGGAVVDTCDYIGFTGSSRTGALIAARAGERLIGCSLELGGKNPMIVLDDADIAATARVGGARLFRQRRPAVPFAGTDLRAGRDLRPVRRRVRRGDRQLRQAAGYDYGADLGSLTSQRALKTVSEHVDDARAKGATVLTGGRPRPDLGPYFYEPTVLTDVTPDMLCHAAETFGPVVSLYPYAHRGRGGGTGERHGVRPQRQRVRPGPDAGRAVAARLRAGTVNVNDGYASAFGSTDAPMGGMGASGLGRRHGAEGLLRYTEVQTVATQRIEMLNPPTLAAVRGVLAVHGGVAAADEDAATALRRLAAGPLEPRYGDATDSSGSRERAPWTNVGAQRRLASGPLEPHYRTPPTVPGRGPRAVDNSADGLRPLEPRYGTGVTETDIPAGACGQPSRARRGLSVNWEQVTPVGLL